MQTNPCHSRRRAGFTMVEVLVATILIGVMMVRALETVSMIYRTRRANADRLTGPALAQQLMGEIVGMAYEDPQYPGAFGLEATESGRATFDDVDDYNGYNALNALSRAGTALSGFTGWRQQVAVARAQVASPNATAASDSGLKRITVTITSPAGRQTVLQAWRGRKGALEQKPALDTTVVSSLDVELRVGSDARIERWGANLFNHAADVN